jgi:hypothetical protein
LPLNQVLLLRYPEQPLDSDCPMARLVADLGEAVVFVPVFVFAYLPAYAVPLRQFPGQSLETLHSVVSQVEDVLFRILLAV